MLSHEINVHGCYSLVKIAFAPIWTCRNNRWIWHHNVIQVMSYINCGDVTMLGQKKTPLASVAKWAIDDGFYWNCLFETQNSIEKWNNAFVTVNIDFWSLMMWFANDFHSWLCHSCGVGGAVRFLVVGTIGQEERPPRCPPQETSQPHPPHTSDKVMSENHWQITSWVTKNLDGAVFDIAQILAYLVHNMSRSQLYLGFGHFGWLSSFFGQ